MLQDAAIASAETSEGTPASTTDGGSETTDSDGGGAGYMAMLRAALARAAPPTAVATVMAWLQVCMQCLLSPCLQMMERYACPEVNVSWQLGSHHQDLGVSGIICLTQEWVAPLQRMLPSRRLLSSLAAGGAAHLEALSRAALARLRAVRLTPRVSHRVLTSYKVSPFGLDWTELACSSGCHGLQTLMPDVQFCEPFLTLLCRTI